MFTEIITTTVIGCLVQFPNLALKDNVIINGGHFNAAIVKMIDAARETAPPLEDNTVWITSAADGKHISGSLHYRDKAIDLRIFNVCGHTWTEARLWAERIKLKLGDNYDIILGLDHIHIELDVKDD